MANNYTGSIAGVALNDGVEDLLCEVEGLGALGIPYSFNAQVTGDGTVRGRVLSLPANKSKHLTIKLPFCPTSKLHSIETAITTAAVTASPVRVTLSGENRTFDYACFLVAPPTTGAEEMDGQIPDVTFEFIILGAWV